MPDTGGCGLAIYGIAVVPGALHAAGNLMAKNPILAMRLAVPAEFGFPRPGRSYQFADRESLDTVTIDSPPLGGAASPRQVAGEFI